MRERAPDAIWSDRPSLRAAVASLIFTMVLAASVWGLVPFWIKGLYEASSGWSGWSADLVSWLQWIAKWLLVLPVLVNLWRIVVLWSIRYEVTGDRFLYHHGILLRVHDEIELQRVRDFRVLRPIFSRMLGLGMIHMTSRDETHPELRMGPFVDARAVQDIIRKQVAVHQRATGFRELETY